MCAFDIQPHLVGELIELRPFRPTDWDTLFRVASDPLVWEQHPVRDRHQEKVFRKFFDEELESKGTLVAIDRRTQEVIGSSNFKLKDDGVQIGRTFLARSHWGGAYNREMKRLMLDYAFQF